MRLFFTVLWSLAATSLIVSGVVVAEEKKEKELPKSGTLSRSVIGGTESTSVNMPWASVQGYDSADSPITGSISKVGNGKWVVRVFNNSDDAYSVSVKVIQYNEKGTQVKADSYSFNVKAKGNAERPVQAYTNVMDCALELVSWRKLGGNKKKEEAAVQITIQPPAAVSQNEDDYTGE